jgi:hypothetical protein
VFSSILVLLPLARLIILGNRRDSTTTSTTNMKHSYSTMNYYDTMNTNSFEFYSSHADASPPVSSAPTSFSGPSTSTLTLPQSTGSGAFDGTSPSVNQSFSDSSMAMAAYHHHRQQEQQQQQQQPHGFATFGKRRRATNAGTLALHFISQDEETTSSSNDDEDEDVSDVDYNINQCNVGLHDTMERRIRTQSRWKRSRTSYDHFNPSNSAGSDSLVPARMITTTTPTCHNSVTGTYHHNNAAAATTWSMFLSIQSPAAAAATVASSTPPQVMPVPWWKQPPKSTTFKTSTMENAESQDSSLCCIVCQSTIGTDDDGAATSDPDVVMPPNALLAYFARRSGAASHKAMPRPLPSQLQQQQQQQPSSRRPQSCTFCERPMCGTCTHECHDCHRLFCAFCVTQDYHQGPYTQTVCAECATQGNKENVGTTSSLSRMTVSSMLSTAGTDIIEGADDDDDMMMMCD